jgi:hypothetical protein
MKSSPGSLKRRSIKIALFAASFALFTLLFFIADWGLPLIGLPRYLAPATGGITALLARPWFKWFDEKWPKQNLGYSQ